MTITLNLTPDEAATLSSILAKLQKQAAKFSLPGLDLADKIRRTILRFDYNHSEKIKAIKELRISSTWSDWRISEDGSCGDVPVMGLAEAKCVVENFDDFLAFVEKNNAVPKINYYGTPKFS